MEILPLPIVIPFIIALLIIVFCVYQCGHDKGWADHIKSHWPTQYRTRSSKAERVYTYGFCKCCNTIRVKSDGPRGDGNWKNVCDLVDWQRADFMDIYMPSDNDEIGTIANIKGPEEIQ